MTLPLLSVATLVAAGCGPGVLGASDAADGFGETGWPDTESETGDEPFPEPEPEPEPIPDCPQVELASEVPLSFSGDKPGGLGAHDASCGGFESNEVGHVFRAPVAGTYRITTTGSSFDTVLWVRSGGESCTGTQLACNDDFGGTLDSEVVVALEQGEAIIIGVDGFDLSDAGDYVLQVALADDLECPQSELPSEVPLDWTVPASQPLPMPQAWCAWDEQQPLAANTFIAPETAGYTVYAFADSGPAAVRALFGESCEPFDEFACAEPEQGLFIDLEAGQEVTLVADAWPSPFNEVTWFIEADVQPPDDCPGINLGEDHPVIVSGDWEFSEPSNGGCGGVDGNGAAFFWTVPAGEGSFEISAEGTPFDHILTVRTGHGCNGPTNACVIGTPDEPAFDFLNLGSGPGGQEFTIVLEPLEPMPFGEYTLSID